MSRHGLSSVPAAAEHPAARSLIHTGRCGLRVGETTTIPRTTAMQDYQEALKRTIAPLTDEHLG